VPPTCLLPVLRSLLPELSPAKRGGAELRSPFVVRSFVLLLLCFPSTVPPLVRIMGRVSRFPILSFAVHAFFLPSSIQEGGCCVLAYIGPRSYVRSGSSHCLLLVLHLFVLYTIRLSGHFPSGSRPWRA